MKKVFFVTLFVLAFISLASANGVAVVNSATSSYLKCVSSSVNVAVENQAAITKTTQEFLNATAAKVRVKYAFPLPEEASATQLRWKIGGVWYQAKMSATPQDTSLPGGQTGTVNQQLKTYLGKSALYFDIAQDIGKDSVLTVELTYVELLKYESGNVTYTYPNNYLAIQSTALTQQNFQFTLTSSARTITAINLLSHIATLITNSGSQAQVAYSKQSAAADKDYSVQYSLSLSELGLFSMSTKIPDTLAPDKLGKGYFLFVAEPDPSANTKVINKVFTLIVDRSGSMAGTKIDQARNAANFIVQHLNTGDKFNIVDFSDVISSFSNGHVDYTAANQTAALSYIAGLSATGSTDIAGAFDKAIPEFAASATANTANIIIFLTDGQPTAGITTSDGILQKIAADVAQVNKKISIFVFGIGSDVNQQLLSLIAQQNSGLAEYLGSDQLESRITGFYTKIRNPVLLKTQAAFLPDIITEVFPVPLPNLYKGEQLVFVGRYASAAKVTVTFSGETFDQPVSYEYQVQLADTAIDKNQFIMKIWAKRKIDDLLAKYYTYAAGSAEANEFKSEITNISMQYGIASPFTSFTGGVTRVKEADLKPFQKAMIQTSFTATCDKNGLARLRFQAGSDVNKILAIKIFNSTGQLVKTLFVKNNGKGLYEAAWDGVLKNGQRAPIDVYFCVIDLGISRVTARLMYIRK